MKRVPHHCSYCGNIIHDPWVSLKVHKLRSVLYERQSRKSCRCSSSCPWFCSVCLLCCFWCTAAQRLSPGVICWVLDTWGFVLWHAGAPEVWRAHLSEHPVQPLQGAVEMQLYPAGGAGHCLPPAGRRIWVSNALACAFSANCRRARNSSFI